MSERRETLVWGHYLLAVQGLAMVRALQSRLPSLPERARDVRAIADGLDRDPFSRTLSVTIYDVEPGYTSWAPRYDGPNPAIATEEPIVRRLLEDAPRGVALDAACGTGRLASVLVGLGHQVIGVDTTPAMLELARARVADADLRAGRLEALPVDDCSVDVVTCGLALTHVERLEPVISEFARVLRPGGQAVISDLHPFATATGAAAAFPAGDGDQGRSLHMLPNLVHQVGEYISAFDAAGLSILACVEPPVTEDLLSSFPTFADFPDATRGAFGGAPYLLIWRLSKPG
jgi:ubiquinone/menaquinone biosynthesis C-methylase UbiE